MSRKAMDAAEEGVLWERQATLDRELRQAPRRQATIIYPIKPRKGYVEIVPTESYLRSEGDLFNLIAGDRGTGAAPYRYVNVTEGKEQPVSYLKASTETEKRIDVAGFSGMYLYSVIAEGHRPKIWIDRAKAKLRELADFIRTRQPASETWDTQLATDSNMSAAAISGWSGALWDVNYSQPYCWTVSEAAAGITLIRAYQTLGDNKYRDAYLRVAADMTQRTRVTYQIGDQGESGYTDYYNFSTRVRDLIALEFWKVFADQEGADYVVTGTMTATTTVALINAFWTVGLADVGSTTVKTGWSSTTPYSYFAPTSPTSYADRDVGTWQYEGTGSTGSYVLGLDFALALRGWVAWYGFDDTASSIYSWLMSFASAAANETIDSTADFNGKQSLLLATTGEYDPTIALATRLRVVNASSVAVADNYSQLYDFGAMGLLAGIQASHGSGLGEAKRLASEPGRCEYTGRRSALFFRPAMRGKSGLSYQVNFLDSESDYTTFRLLDVQRAAMAGLAYRESPVVYQETDA